MAAFSGCLLKHSRGITVVPSKSWLPRNDLLVRAWSVGPLPLQTTNPLGIAGEGSDWATIRFQFLLLPRDFWFESVSWQRRMNCTNCCLSGKRRTRWSWKSRCIMRENQVSDSSVCACLWHNPTTALGSKWIWIHRVEALSEEKIHQNQWLSLNFESTSFQRLLIILVFPA